MEAIKYQSAVSIYFKDLTATKIKKDVSLHWSQIFGLFGGLLGICLGFTFVSVFDVIYTFTIRVLFDYLSKTKGVSMVGSGHKAKPFALQVKEQNNFFVNGDNVFLN